MVSEQQATYSLNIGLHILILFTFLTVFFFIIISNTEKNAINKQLDNVINQQNIYNSLDDIDKISQQYKIQIDWGNIYNAAKSISSKSQGTDPNIDSQNNRLKIISLILISTFIIILISLYIYYRFVLKLNVNLWDIFSENAIIFLFIGAIEYIFFMQIAANYIPVTSSYVSDSILDRFKERIQNTL